VEFCHFPVNATFFTLNATLFSGNSWQVVANLGTGKEMENNPVQGHSGKQRKKYSDKGTS
jgi:hypothetical protein